MTWFALAIIAASGTIFWIGDGGGALSLHTAPRPSGPETPVDERYPQRWTDFHGYEFILEAAPKTLASQALAIDHFLFAVVPEAKIAAVSALADSTQYSHVAARVRALELPVTRDPETLLAIGPSVLLVSQISFPDFVRVVRASGMPVYTMKTLFSRLEEIASALKLVGDLSGERERAREAIDAFRRSTSEATAKVPEGAPRQRVLGFTYFQQCLGSGSLFDHIVTELGARNVCADEGLGVSQKIDPEQIASWDPDWIVSGSGGQPLDEVRASLAHNPAVQLTTAGRRGQLLVIEDREFTTMSQHVLGTMHALADALYPPGQSP